MLRRFNIILSFLLLFFGVMSYSFVQKARIFTKSVPGAKNKVIVLLSDAHTSQFNSEYWEYKRGEEEQLPFLIRQLQGRNMPILIEYPDPNDEEGGWKTIAQDRIVKNKSVFMLQVAHDAREKGIPVCYKDIRGTFIHMATTLIDIRIAFDLNPYNWNFMEYYCDTLGYYVQLMRTNLGQEIDSIFTYASIKKDLDQRLERLSDSAKELPFLNSGEQGVVTEIINNYIQQIKNRYSKLISNLMELGMNKDDFNMPLLALYERLGDKIQEIYSKYLAASGDKQKSSLQLNELCNYTCASDQLTDAGFILAMIKQLQTHNGVVAITGCAHADNLVAPIGKLGYKLIAEGELQSDQIVKAIETTMPAAAV